MDEFMKILLSLSVSGTLLLLLIWGLKPLYKHRFSRRWQYYIWIIAVMRFLLPFTPDTTIAGSLFEKFDTAMVMDEIPTNRNVSDSVNADEIGAEAVQTNRDRTAGVMRKPLYIYVWVFFIWIALVLVLFVHKITVYHGFIQYIKAGSAEVSDIKMLNLLSDCEEKLNMKKRVELVCNPLVTAPLMTGFLCPCIVLPAVELGDKELSYIFMHELIHYKQKDMFYKWLIQIAVCIHWFNPFVYLLEKEVNKSCELSCDEKLISVLGDKVRREYGDTLLSFLKPDKLCKSSFASVTLTEGAEQLKERLGAIMEFKKKSKTVTAVTAVFSVAACACFFITGAYAVPSAANGNTAQKDASSQYETNPAAVSDASAAYKKLTAYKTSDYSQQSVASFNAMLAPTPDELTELLAAQADVISSISSDDENYDFFTTTMDFSANELYCGHMEEDYTFFAGISKKSRPYSELDEDGEITYEFCCFADLQVTYSISSPELITVAERDHILLSFQKEMQNYLDGLSEAEITDSNFKAMLSDKAAELTNSLSAEYMELSSCDISLIEIFDAGTDFVQYRM